MPFLRLTPFVSLLALATLLMPGMPVGASSEAVIHVTTTNDEVLPHINDGHCSLREAIWAANTNTAVDSCAAGGSGTDTIILPAGLYQLSLAGVDENSALTGDLDIQESLVIQGAGRGASVIDGNQIDRVFHIMAGASVEINGLTIQNGNALSGLLGGGGILNQGTLTLRDVAVQNNHAVNVGGGMDNYFLASATIIDSTIISNTSTVDGGGIFNTSQLFLYDSTLSGNTASSGGGGLDNRDSATLRNVTISGNTASDGGGVFSDGELFILFSSFVANTATAIEPPNGGNIANFNGSIRIKTSIVANSQAGPNCANNGSIVSEGHNLENTNTCGFNTITDLHNVADAMLGPLADNGGLTLTHALLLGSPAIDAGNDVDCPSKDQRGAYRPADGNGDSLAICDIGAFEFQGVFPKLIYAPFIVR